MASSSQQTLLRGRRRTTDAAGALGLSQALGLCSRPAFGRQGHQTKPDFFWPWIALQTHTNIAEKMHGSHSGLKLYEKCTEIYLLLQILFSSFLFQKNHVVFIDKKSFFDKKHSFRDHESLQKLNNHAYHSFQFFFKKSLISAIPWYNSDWIILFLIEISQK